MRPGTIRRNPRYRYVTGQNRPWLTMLECGISRRKTVMRLGLVIQATRVYQSDSESMPPAPSAASRFLKKDLPRPGSQGRSALDNGSFHISR